MISNHIVCNFLLAEALQGDVMEKLTKDETMRGVWALKAQCMRKALEIVRESGDSHEQEERDAS